MMVFSTLYGGLKNVEEVNTGVVEQNVMIVLIKYKRPRLSAYCLI